MTLASHTTYDLTDLSLGTEESCVHACTVSPSLISIRTLCNWRWVSHWCTFFNFVENPEKSQSEEGVTISGHSAAAQIHPSLQTSMLLQASRDRQWNPSCFLLVASPVHAGYCSRARTHAMNCRCWLFTGKIICFEQPAKETALSLVKGMLG